MTSSPLPAFAKPPVVEVVIGVQFEALPAFSNALAGWFWKGFLDASWSTIVEVARLEDVFELFDDGARWKQRPAFVFRQSAGAERLQIMQKESNRLIQVQDTRFILNRAPTTGANLIRLFVNWWMSFLH